MNGEPDYEKELRKERQRSQKLENWMFAWAAIAILLFLLFMHVVFGWWPSD
jgi:hypothetical protein